MLFTTRINNIVTAYPRLSRVWIKTGNPRTPLKGVWINEAHLHCVLNHSHESACCDASAELAEDHLSLAA